MLHIRNLPYETTEEELRELCSPFGPVVQTKLNVGANKNQAFVEFPEQSMGINMVTYFANSADPAKVRAHTGRSSCHSWSGALHAGLACHICCQHPCGTPARSAPEPSRKQDRCRHALHHQGCLLLPCWPQAPQDEETRRIKTHVGARACPTGRVSMCAWLTRGCPAAAWQVRGKTVYLQYSTRQEIVNSTRSAEQGGNVLLVSLENLAVRVLCADPARHPGTHLLLARGCGTAQPYPGSVTCVAVWK